MILLLDFGHDSRTPSQGPDYCRLGRYPSAVGAAANLPENADHGGYDTLEPKNKRTSGAAAANLPGGTAIGDYDEKKPPRPPKPNQYEEIEDFNSYVMVPPHLDSMCVNPLYVSSKAKIINDYV